MTYTFSKVEEKKKTLNFNKQIEGDNFKLFEVMFYGVIQIKSLRYLLVFVHNLPISNLIIMKININLML